VEGKPLRPGVGALNTDTDEPPDPVVEVADFASIYQSHYRSVLGLVYTLSGSRVVAEELTRDAFVKARRRWDSVAGHPNREAWVKGVAINRARSWLRRNLIEAKAKTRMTRERPRMAEIPESADQMWAAVRGLR